MSRILVTGAAGNVGSRLVHRLAQSNTPVRALVRLSEQRTFEAGVEVVRGDLNDREQVRAATQRFDTKWPPTGAATQARESPQE